MSSLPHWPSVQLALGGCWRRRRFQKEDAQPLGSACDVPSALGRSRVSMPQCWFSRPCALPHLRCLPQQQDVTWMDPWESFSMFYFFMFLCCISVSVTAHLPPFIPVLWWIGIGTSAKWVWHYTTAYIYFKYLFYFRNRCSVIYY